MARRAALPPLLGLLALLAACASPADAAPRRPQPECVFGEGEPLILRGSTGIVADAQVNGQPVALEIGTGLGLTSLQPEAAQRLNLPEDPRVQSGYSGPAGPVTRRNVLTRSLRAGGQEWSGRSIAVRPFSGLSGARPFDGILGLDLLRQTELEIDLPGRRVTLHRARDCRPGNPPWPVAASLPLDLPPSGAPVIMVQVNGQAVRARIQSGDNVSSMSQALADRLGLNTPTGRRGRSAGGDAVTRRSTEYRLETLAAGEEVLRDQRVVVVAADPSQQNEELRLGQDWLGQRRVWLSFANRRLFLGR